MSVLLDTHYVYAIAGAPGRLSAREIRYLSEFSEPFHVSAVSLWEIRLKWQALFSSGQRKGPLAPEHVLSVLSSQNVEFVPVSATHAVTELDVPLEHNDPFDQLLLAQAQAEGLKLLTRDDKLKPHPLSICVS